MMTFEEILERMKSKYTELSGNVPSENSDVSVRMTVLAGEIYSSLVNMEWLKRQMFASSAQGEYLDFHAQARGLERRKASCAAGSVIFSVSEAAVSQINIPKGTVVATSTGTPLRFETTQEVFIPAGATSVHAQIRSLETGRKNNVAAGKITVMVTPPASVEAVTNPDPCVSGTDTESDDSLRARIIESYKFASNGTNCAYYKTVSTQIEGVASAGVVPRGRGAGTVDVYVSGEGSEVSDEVLEKVQKVLSEKREVNVDVKAFRAEPESVGLYIYLDVADGYEFEEVKARCLQAVEDYICSRGVGGSVYLNHISEVIYHLEGVRDFYLPATSNHNIKCAEDRYLVPGKIIIAEGLF